MATRGRGNNGQGMNWVHPTTRLAIYLRDGMACCYCGVVLEDGVMLTLDHIRSRSRGGSNSPSNLVTACRTCNSSRGDRSVTAFARDVARYRAIPSERIVAHIGNRRRRKMERYRTEARQLIQRRGSLSEALASCQQETA